MKQTNKHKKSVCKTWALCVNALSFRYVRKCWPSQRIWSIWNIARWQMDGIIIFPHRYERQQNNNNKNVIWLQAIYDIFWSGNCCRRCAFVCFIWFISCCCCFIVNFFFLVEKAIKNALFSGNSRVDREDVETHENSNVQRSRVFFTSNPNEKNRDDQHIIVRINHIPLHWYPRPTEENTRRWIWFFSSIFQQ